MNPITMATLFFGYLLVYAATANHGHYATNPWGGVLHDAYRDDVAPPPGAQGPIGPSGTPTGGSV